MNCPSGDQVQLYSPTAGSKETTVPPVGGVVIGATITSVVLLKPPFASVKHIWVPSGEIEGWNSLMPESAIARVSVPPFTGFLTMSAFAAEFGVAVLVVERSPMTAPTPAYPRRSVRGTVGEVRRSPGAVRVPDQHVGLQAAVGDLTLEGDASSRQATTRGGRR